jgi:formamidopyrimidine-DNA glycosylase
MPELPEVEITARRLRAALPGRRIVELEVPDPRLLRGDAPGAPPEQTAAGWQSRLAGAAFAGVRRRAKYLLLALDTGETLVGHLRMTGKLIVIPPVTVPGSRLQAPSPTKAPSRRTSPHRRFAPVPPSPKRGGEPREAERRVPALAGSGEPGARSATECGYRLAAALDDGARLVFVDPRRLGELWRVPTAELATMPALARLGPDALEEPPSAERLAALGGRSRQPIKAWLMDQRHLGGLGNICAAEILFRAGLPPDCPAADLPWEAWERLAAEIPEYLRWAIDAQWDGELKYLGERDAVNPFALYRRAGAPCPRCGTPIRRLVIAGRGTYVCPRCQA